jgi:hypothetical protein
MTEGRAVFVPCRVRCRIVVQRRDGQYRCILCDAVVAVPLGKSTRTIIERASGKPNIRVILVVGV